MKFRKEFEVDGQKLEVVFDLLDGEEINEFQRKCYEYAEKNIKKIYKFALKSIKKHIKTKEFHERYISDYGITEKEIFESITFNAIYFARTETRGFGFLGGWEADIEHGIGVKFKMEDSKAILKEIASQDCLI